MTLEPLLNAAPLTQAHAYLAMAAIVVGGVQIAAPKGAIPHRTLGWAWIALIALMLVAAFANHGFIFWDPFSPAVCCKDGTCGGRAVTCASIHLVSLYFLLALPFGALAARRRHVNLHRRSMLWLFLGVLVVGTVLTMIPHRIMHTVIFGS